MKWLFGEAGSRGNDRAGLIGTVDRKRSRYAFRRHDGRCLVAKIAVVAHDAHQARELCIAFGIRRLVMLMARMLIMELGRRMVLLHGDRVIAVVLLQRVLAKRHDGREHTVAGKPQQHPTNHYEAKIFHTATQTR